MSDVHFSYCLVLSVINKFVAADRVVSSVSDIHLSVFSDVYVHLYLAEM